MKIGTHIHSTQGINGFICVNKRISKHDTILVYRQFNKTSISPIITLKLLS